MKRLKFKLSISLVLITSIISAKEYHVSVNGNDKNAGSDSKPFRTINFAAQVAQPGDVVTVHAGTYREWINPGRGGESDSKRIVYRAASGEKAGIKGSEIMTGWKKEKDGVWKVTIPNSYFGDYNPYQDTIHGDWFRRQGRMHHTGEVFLNGKSLWEKETIEKLYNSTANSYTWYCESNADNTTIWANFQKSDPNKELAEISTRRTCFYPAKPGINYITIQGFHISQAATQWAPPTAEQIGMIATHWNKGWIIENNVISDSKCSGITLGKERGTGQNVWSADLSVDGGVSSIEVIFRALRIGWNKDHVGSHIVRNNEIYNCEQAGICGNMGAAFSVIENNYIHHIWTKRQFAGAEIAGIKFHAAIDTRIEKNRVHDTGRGIWLDWMAQGARVTKNLLYNNSLGDIYLEVNHGPTLVDNNIMLSPMAIRFQSQGTAFVHNLIAGQISMRPDPARFTPYHLPHSTEIAGISSFLMGDDRYYNNIFLGNGAELTANDIFSSYGTVGYNQAKRPVWIDGNIYYNHAVAYKGEINYIEKPTSKIEVRVIEEGDQVFLNVTSEGNGQELKTQLITTEILGKAKMPKEAFENPDGTPLKIDMDYFGKKRSDANPLAGPFENPRKDIIKLKVW